MASGLIYLAIVGMWIAYFVPRWVHSHDEFSGKSVERYKSALRIVASGTGSEISPNSVLHTDLDHESKMAQVLMRRRIIFALLSITLMVTIMQVILNSLPYTYILLPLTGVIIYVAHIRRQSSAIKSQRRRVMQLQRATAGISITNLSQVVTPKVSQDHWVPLSERELTGIVLLPKGTAQDRNAWQPNSVPVPTYVTAPKAFVPKRTIDLTIPGVWSDEQERLAEEALSAAAPSKDEVFDQQLADEAVDRLKQNRAANE